MGAAVKVTRVPAQTLLSEAEMLRLTGRVSVTVATSTFEATAPVQSCMQSTLASLLYQVVWVMAPGLYEAELLTAISVKPVLLLTVDCCHLYSRVPVCPVGTAMLFKAAGV